MTTPLIRSLVLEPGNSTRYDLDVISLFEDHLLVVLYKNRKRVGARAMRFSTGKSHSTYKPSEVAKKMGCDMTEAAVILAYLRSEHDLRVDLAEDFNQETGVWVGHTIH